MVSFSPWTRLIVKFKNFRNHEFVSSSSVLMRGNILAQLLLLCVVPVLTRLFDPEVFGVFALFTALVAIISRVGSLCYERTIVLPKDQQSAVFSVYLSFLILFVISCLTGLLIIAFSDLITRRILNINDILWFYMVPLGVLLTGAVNILRNWALRNNSYGTMSYSRISDAVMSSSIKIILGILLGSWVGGLVLGMMLGTTVSLLLLMSVIVRGNNLVTGQEKLASGLVRVAKEYKTFPLYASWSALLNILSNYLVIFFLTVLYGPSIVGLYSLSSRMMQQPVVMISQAVANVYLKKSATQISSNLPTIYGLNKTIRTLAAFGLVPFLFIMATGQELFEFVFGSQWSEAGLYTQILAPWFFVLFIGSPANIIYEVHHRQKIKLLINLITIILCAVTLSIFFWIQSSVVVVLIAFSFINVLMGIITIIIAKNIASKHL